jgi:hypothetical protein
MPLSLRRPWHKIVPQPRLLSGSNAVDDRRQHSVVPDVRRGRSRDESEHLRRRWSCRRLAGKQQTARYTLLSRRSPMRWDGRKAAVDVCCLCGEDRRVRVQCGRNVAPSFRDSNTFNNCARGARAISRSRPPQEIRPPVSRAAPHNRRTVYALRLPHGENVIHYRFGNRRCPTPRPYACGCVL